MVALIAAIHESDGLGEDMMQNARDHFHRRSSVLPGSGSKITAPLFGRLPGEGRGPVTGRGLDTGRRRYDDEEESEALIVHFPSIAAEDRT